VVFPVFSCPFLPLTALSCPYSKKTKPMYQLLKPLLFSLDPEAVHDSVMRLLEMTARNKALLGLVQNICTVPDKKLETECMGLRFPNPIGLAAGLDKNALALPIWAALGFGFLEIGSVTAKAQSGNEKPRLFRLPEDEALINRMGFNNHGADVVAARLELWQHSHGAPSVPLGVNLGKSKITPLEEAPQDYLYSLQKLWKYGDYFVLNVSSPNTPNLRQLQDRAPLEELLGSVMAFVRAQVHPKPIALKIAPNLGWEQLDEILELAQNHALSAIIATNTTTARAGLRSKVQETGGLSGTPLKLRSLEVLSYLVKHTKLPIVSVGGISSPEDAKIRLETGARLVQLYSGFIFEGPMLPKRLAQGLLA
jgi:dihydroorotate dehydrogenase